MRVSNLRPQITMNSSPTVTFPPRPPALKLTRSVAPHTPEDHGTSEFEEERRQLAEDHEALRVREENLRDYEARLRAIQASIDESRAAASVRPVESPASMPRTAAAFARPASRAPFESDVALQAAWEKLHRAQELFEAERSHLRDERMVSHEREAAVKRREVAVAQREMRLVEREAAVMAAVQTEKAPANQPVAAEHTISAVTRLTRAPFDMARSVFGGKK